MPEECAFEAWINPELFLSAKKPKALRRRTRKVVLREQKERRKMGNALRYRIMRRDGFACVLCGATAPDEKLVVDHVMPIARGGKTESTNLRTLCSRCNTGKGTKLERRTNQCHPRTTPTD